MSVQRESDFGNRFTIRSDKKSYEVKPSRLEFYVTGMQEIHVHMDAGDRWSKCQHGHSMIISADDSWDLMEWLQENLEPAKARTRRSKY